MLPVQPVAVERIPTPTGPVAIVTDADGVVCAVEWDDHAHRMHRLLLRYYGVDGQDLREGRQPSTARLALEAYFAGALDAIDAVPTVAVGSEFQRLVWTALRRIPAGQPTSYGALAVQIGRPSAVRAVGLANGANPIPIIVPCHRVIGANGSLTGFGGGMERKRWLLAHEDRTPTLLPN